MPMAAAPGFTMTGRLPVAQFLCPRTVRPSDLSSSVALYVPGSISNVSPSSAVLAIGWSQTDVATARTARYSVAIWSSALFPCEHVMHDESAAFVSPQASSAATCVSVQRSAIFASILAFALAMVSAALASAFGPVSCDARQRGSGSLVPQTLLRSFRHFWTAFMRMFRYFAPSFPIFDWHFW